MGTCRHRVRFRIATNVFGAVPWPPGVALACAQLASTVGTLAVPNPRGATDANGYEQRGFVVGRARSHLRERLRATAESPFHPLQRVPGNVQLIFRFNGEQA
ncbi:hypothetical protein GCM10009105_17620 [Dokdonella soli]|uniref:Uncharacterized protein n=1 Tax=Dokdonella soli TaxID=529810 RepID=A0ABN1IHL6_9GAMM